MTRSKTEPATSSAQLVSAHPLRLPLTLGIFCKARAKHFHRLAHWEYRVFRSVKRCHQRLLHVVAERAGQSADELETEEDSRGDEYEHTTESRLKEIRQECRDLMAGIGEKGAGDTGDAELPRDAHRVNEVIKWMDAIGFLANRVEWLGAIENLALKLESEEHH